MVNEVVARRAVEAVLTEWPPPSNRDEEVVVWKVDEHSTAWIVHVATRRWLETRDLRDQLVGACPFVVEKATGRLHKYGSAPDEHAKFTAWLDSAPEDEAL